MKKINDNLNYNDIPPKYINGRRVYHKINKNCPSWIKILVEKIILDRSYNETMEMF